MASDSLGGPTGNRCLRRSDQTADAVSVVEMPASHGANFDLAPSGAANYVFRLNAGENKGRNYRRVSSFYSDQSELITLVGAFSA
jgi:hypothetical protein